MQPKRLTIPQRARSRCAAAAAACLATLAMIHTAHAYGPGKLHREGVEEMKKGNLDLAEGRLKRAYDWGKRKSGDKINPSFVTDYCKVLVLLKNWYFAKDICAEAAKVDRARAAEVKRLLRQIARAKLVGKAETAAKWAAQDLRGDRYDSAVEGYQKAIKMYPRADFYLGLCKALNKQGNPGKALAACNKVLKMRPDAATRSAARAMIAPLKKASASAFSPEQKKAVDKLRDLISKVQFIHPDHHLSLREQKNQIATSQRCLDQVAQVRKSGVDLKRTIRIYDAPKGLKVLRKTRKIQHGRLTGWWKHVRVSDVAALCQGYGVKLKLLPVQTAMRKAAGVIEPIARMEREKSGWTKLERKAIGKLDMKVTVLRTRVSRCAAPIHLALAQKLPATTPVDTHYAGRIPLGQLEAKVCKPINQRIAALDKAVQTAFTVWKARKMAPFKKVLRGDKLRLVDQRELFDMVVYGRHKRRLRTPRSFRRARVWFFVSTYENGCAVKVCWNVQRLRFRGHRLVRTTHRRGYGAYPPRRAFR